MYDARSEPNEFIADTPNEAKAKACEFFDVEEAALRVIHIEEGVVFGMGGRSLVIAVPTSAAGRPRPEPSRDDRRDDHREERGRRRGGRESSSEPRRDREPRSDREPRRDREPRSEPPKPQAAERPAVESKGTIDGEVGPIGKFIVGTLERMGLGSFALSESKEGDFIVYQVSGDAASQIAEDGRAVDALQLLANQAERQLSEEPARIVVDVEGEGERREEFLEKLAERAAQRSIDSGNSIALDPMNGHDRRIVHMAVRDMDSVVTMSIGEGRYRQVVLVPEGAADYEKARQGAERAESDS